MPAYDHTHFDPPAPVALVTLQNPDRRDLAAQVSLLIDTGADATLIPRSVIEALDITPTGEQIDLVGFDGTPSRADVVQVHLVFLGKRFRGRYLLIEAESGVLGRDVLRHVRLRLEGPASRWEELAS